MPTKPGLPHANSRIAKYLTKQIDALAPEKNQREIAAEIGYSMPNIISMFKRGETKVPIDKVPAIAKALKVDPSYLFRLAMEQYWTNNQEAINEIFGTVVSKNEAEIIKEIRTITDDADPVLTPEIAAQLKRIFAT